MITAKDEGNIRLSHFPLMCYQHTASKRIRDMANTGIHNMLPILIHASDNSYHRQLLCIIIPSVFQYHAGISSKRFLEDFNPRLLKRHDITM